PASDLGPNFIARTKSDKFEFDVEILTPRARIVAQHSDLKWFGWFGALTILLAITGYVTLVPRRAPRNPVIEVERALKAGEFVPYYQPIVDISTGKLRGAEVLARWRKPDGTMVLPGAFIPLMESGGLIRELTRILMRAVCVEA